MRGKQFVNNNSTPGTVFFSFYDATKRSSLTFMTPEGQPRVLAENNPDAAANRALELISKLNLSHAGKDSFSASNQLNIAKTIVQLTQKSPADILVRDALYRLNEMYLNTLCLKCKNCENQCDTCCAQQLTRFQYERIFNGVLNTAQVVSQTDAKVMEEQTKQLQIKAKNDSTVNALTKSIQGKDSTIKTLTDTIGNLKKQIDVNKPKPSDNSQPPKQQQPKDSTNKS
jgi:hypothetical protein